MKPFLGIDLTTDKKNEQLNGSEFIVAKPSEEMTRALEKSLDGADEVYEKATLPIAVRIVKWICGAVGGFVGVCFIRALEDISIKEAYQNATEFVWVGGACILVWLILEFLSRKKAKTVMETDKSSHTFSRLESVSDAVFTELAVPADAKDVDILSFFYKVKEGEIKVHEKGLQIAQYYNFNYKIFADSENFYMANLEEKYAFPLSSLRAIHTVKKRIILYSWNKEEKHNKGVYKQYKLDIGEGGEIHCKNFHILEFEHNGELWGVYFPAYELPAFEEITGLKAE